MIPDGSWVTQQARPLVWEVEDREPRLRYLIHARDRKFTDAFDAVFRAEGIKCTLTPTRASNANSDAERWVRSVRSESLDKLLIVNQRNLRSMIIVHSFINRPGQLRRRQGLQKDGPVLIIEAAVERIHVHVAFGTIEGVG